MSGRFKRLKEVMDHYFSDVKMDAKWFKQIEVFKQQYYSRNPEHIGFFTGAYYGLHIPKWTGRDDDWWFIDLIGIDEDELADEVLGLETINENWHVSSNTLNITMLYLMHVCQTSKLMSRKDADHYKVVLMEILVARFFTSRLNHYFNKGPTSQVIAQEVYDRMSKRYILKEEGSWMKLIHNRAVLFSMGEHERDAKFGKQEVFDGFDDDLVVRKLNSIKTSVNDTISQIDLIFRAVLEDDKKTTKTSSMGVDGEGLYLKDLVKHQSEYLRYQDQVFADRNSFFKTELMEVIESSMPTISSNIFREALVWIYEMQNDKKWKKKIDQFRHDILIYALAMIQEEGIKQTDIVQVAYRIRQNFMSGKSSDKTLVECRKLGDSFIVAYRPKSKGKLITLERVAIMMYFVLRTLTKHFYT